MALSMIPLHLYLAWADRRRSCVYLLAWGDWSWLGRSSLFGGPHIAPHTSNNVFISMTALETFYFLPCQTWTINFPESLYLFLTCPSLPIETCYTCIVAYALTDRCLLPCLYLYFLIFGVYPICEDWFSWCSFSLMSWERRQLQP